jgi:CRP-like cAMP-binding protein
LPSSRFDFRCEAYNDCTVGSLGWDDFKKITANSPELVRTFHQNDVRHWYRLLLRSSSFLKLDLHERVAITLLELAADFGIKESRGALLKAPFSHQPFAAPSKTANGRAPLGGSKPHDADDADDNRVPLRDLSRRILESEAPGGI